MTMMRAPIKMAHKNYDASILSDKYYNLIPSLISTSQKSSISCKHAAMIVKNGKQIVSGYNIISADNSQHAECTAIKNYLKIHNIWLTKNELKVSRVL